jgi:long-chain acyl-CoA synthetase
MSRIERWTRQLAHLGLRLWMMAFHHFEPRGRLRLDRPSLIVANHASHLDIAAIFCALPFDQVTRVRTAAAKDVIFAWPAIPLALVKLLFNVFPFERKAGSTGSLEACEAHLRAGYHVVIFPEGRRSADGSFLGFTPGFAKVAYRTGAPIVALRIEGTERALHREALFPVVYPIETAAAEPIDPVPLRAIPHERRREAYAAIVKEAELRMLTACAPSTPASPA